MAIAIHNVAELQAMQNDLAGDYELANDIDASATKNWNWDGVRFQGFRPIGLAYAVVIERPTGDHSSGGAWIINPADGILWDKVSEVVPDEDATYIMATAHNDWALFSFAPFAIPADAVNIRVWVYLRLRRVAADASSARALLRVGGNEYEGVSVHVPDAYGNRYGYWSTNPNTGVDWTPGEVNGIGANALELFGVRVTDAIPNVRITQAWIRVTYDRVFTGSFNGNGYTIRNLYINRPDDYAGLFEKTVLGMNEIKNLNMTDFDLRGNIVGPLAQYITTGRVSDISVQGQLTGEHAYICGLVNDCDSGVIFSNCKAMVNIEDTGELANSNSILGFVGGAWDSPIFRDCSVVCTIRARAPGTYTGFVGWMSDDALFERCSASGSIIVNIGYDNERNVGIGGFAASPGFTAKFLSCSADVDITLTSAVRCRAVDIGGFLSYTYEDEHFDHCEAKGDISVTLNGLWRHLDLGGFVAFTCRNEVYQYCKATGDITVNLNGDPIFGASVSGFVSFSCDLETFYRCGATGNISFVQSDVNNSRPTIGGFTAYACASEKYRECFATGDIDAVINDPDGRSSWIGGLMGAAWCDRTAILEDCYALGKVAVIGDNVYAAGLFGEAYLWGAPITGYFRRCYSAGLVSATGAGNIVGGCLASDDGQTFPFTDIFWDVETSGQATSVRGEGKTTAEMKEIDTFIAAGWDIGKAYEEENDGYPCLGWQVDNSHVWLLPRTWGPGFGPNRPVPLGLVRWKGGFAHSKR